MDDVIIQTPSGPYIVTAAHIARYSTIAGFPVSAYQAAIARQAEEGTGNIAVGAVAGSGKTTLLVKLLASLVRGDAAFFAFGKDIAKAIGLKLKERGVTTMTAKTIHSACWSPLDKAIKQTFPPGLRAAEPDERKYRRICKQVIDAFVRMPAYQLAGKDPPKPNDLTNELFDLVNKARLNAVDPQDRDGLMSLIATYEIDVYPFENQMIAMFPGLIAEGERLARNGEIDFTDMPWLAYRWNLRLWQSQWVFIDESQDLSRLSQEIVSRMIAPGGRIVVVGDERQAVMGFAGADTNAFGRLKARFTAFEMPLNICYRCPASHIRLARALVPTIEARPDAPEGVILNVHPEDLESELRNGDIVLGRFNAPLITLCIKLIAHQRPARVKGRDVAKKLVGIIRDKISVMPAYVTHGFLAFEQAVGEWEAMTLANLALKDASETAIRNAVDTATGIKACYEGFGYATQHALIRNGKPGDVGTVDDLCQRIASLFSDQQSSIWLSTVHKFKGAEAERIFLLDSSKWPYSFKRSTADEEMQERNLYYVALTRSTSTLGLVDESYTKRVTATLTLLPERQLKLDLTKEVVG